MATLIKCPNCGFEFPLEDALNDELKESIEKEKQQLRQQMLDYKKTKEEELRRKEEDFARQKQFQEDSFQKRLDDELKKKNQYMEESIRKSLSADYENQFRMLKDSAAENEEKLKEARKKELEFLQREKALKEKESEMELQLQRQLMAERGKMKEQLQKEEQERMSLKEQEYNLRMREMEKQIEDQKKLVDEMKRKAEQGSMQLQGEAQELLLEEILQSTFPFDKVQEVGKGVRGADCVQIVRNQFGSEAGKIIYESKRTKDFGGDWIEKLKHDMRTLGADVAVIVTQAFPKDMDRFGEKNGVYICSFSEVRSVALLLRNAILKIADTKKSQENRGDKMVMLYDYLIGNEFGEQWKAIREGFMSMKLSIQKERDAMEKLWKAREKQLEKVLLNAAHIKGSIEGIAGADAVNLNLLEDNEPDLLD
ncbi:DUF2130 domain-containing protein [Panacibacter ginsenosidivorans]|uniref:DUF2130 domain-containing protein n=1 Tax=Panacibacter ginsenosidivorans TaxID=1813871 RepID=A0A5B8VA05_9BACT|nr:DUF2130 domain-containing protein [Panacibacter ginsenosidivorans]QEC68172.1 DUF2130 domain-containing protein [Panacibacter ginsenosidivorans]